MSVTTTELQNFTEFVAERIAADADLSLEDCLLQWRGEQEKAALSADVRASLADIEAGRVWTLEEADAEIRRRLGWPAQSQGTH